MTLDHESDPAPRTRTLQKVQVPTFLYGTAWKEERTRELVEEALAAGFRGLDTANQRRHYHEVGVGAAVAAAGIPRDQLFLQTKFTYPEGQDHRLPYDADAALATRVRQSFESSLEHLGVERLDSLVLHGPRVPVGLSEDDLTVWRTFEELHRDGKVRLLGVSNVRAGQVEKLCDHAEVPPAFVQNRCFARTGWDREVREGCEMQGIAYQGFSLLTANQRELAEPAVRVIARRHGRTIPQVIFRFALQAGMIPLTGTTDRRHMEEDLEVYDFELSAAEVARIANVAG